MVKSRLKHFLRRSVHRLLGLTELHERLEHLQLGLGEPFNWARMLNEIVCANQGVQMLLSRSYRASVSSEPLLPRLNDTELRCFSQSGEDGILLYLFSLVGTTNKTVVEICAGNGVECNAANLIVNHGWFGLLVDGDARNIALGQQFYAHCRDTLFRTPIMVASWVTAENVNALVSENNFAGEIDLLSLDLDGMDYWVWKALTCVRPRAVILEFNARSGPERAVTLPYQPNFRMDWDRDPWFCGASLAAFVKLGRERGYRLVGTNRIGSNALFLRRDVGGGVFPEITPAQAYQRSTILCKWRPSDADYPDYWNLVEV